MKKLILLIALFSSITIMAQDVIVKKDGRTILAKVTKVGDKEVEYKKYNSKSDRLYLAILLFHQKTTMLIQEK